MATKIESARQMVYTTAWRFNNGEYPVREISMAKLHASRVAVDVADECIQIHGGAGYMKEYGVERAWRDLRLNRIGAGHRRDHLPLGDAVSGARRNKRPRTTYAPARTHSASGPRNEMFGWKENSWPSTSRRRGKRRVSASSATSASSLPRVAPRQ